MDRYVFFDPSRVPPLSGVGLLCSKRYLVHHSKFYFFRLDVGPRFGHEAPGGQTPVVEQRNQDALPASAKDTDQAQARGLALPWEQQPGGWQGGQRAERDSGFGCPA